MNLDLRKGREKARVESKIRWEIAEGQEISTATLVLPEDYWPVQRKVGSKVYHLRASVAFPKARYVWAASTFIGLLRGDRAEVAVELEAMENPGSSSGPRLYLRSFHRHEAQDFESWLRQPIGVRCAGMVVDVRAQSMTKDPITLHIGVVLTLR